MRQLAESGQSKSARCSGGVTSTKSHPCPHSSTCANLERDHLASSSFDSPFPVASKPQALALDFDVSSHNASTFLVSALIQAIFSTCSDRSAYLDVSNHRQRRILLVSFHRVSLRRLCAQDCQTVCELQARAAIWSLVSSRHMSVHRRQNSMSGLSRQRSKCTCISMLRSSSSAVSSPPQSSPQPRLASWSAPGRRCDQQLGSTRLVRCPSLVFEVVLSVSASSSLCRQRS